MVHPFPTGDLFRELPAAWTMKAIPNESLHFHIWVMRREMQRGWNYFFRFTLLVVPKLIEWLLRKADFEPSYRMIFVLTRQEPPAKA